MGSGFRGGAKAVFDRLASIDALNAWVTNRLPRRAATRLAGRIARSEHPLLRGPALAAFRFFCAPDLAEARETRFASLRDCFIRALAPGCRPIDPRPEILASPCDAIIGACGRVADGMLLQVKGSPYRLDELLGDPALAATHRDATYATLRLTAGMYHRFHAPRDASLRGVDHIPGDTWNVNPPTLARVPRVYCRNERAVLRFQDADGQRITLVPVAAILVAGLVLHAVALPDRRQRDTVWHADCDIPVVKGAELGWFEHGSTIIVLAAPAFVLSDGVRPGGRIRMGEALMRCASAP